MSNLAYMKEKENMLLMIFQNIKDVE